jgi:hypothetical protein
MLLHFDFSFVEFFRMLCMYFQPNGILYIAVTMEDMIIIDREIFTVGVPSRRRLRNLFSTPTIVGRLIDFESRGFSGFHPPRLFVTQPHWRRPIQNWRMDGWMDEWMDGGESLILFLP